MRARLRCAGFLCWASVPCCSHIDLQQLLIDSGSQKHTLAAAASGTGRVGSRVRPTQHVT